MPLGPAAALPRHSSRMVADPVRSFPAGDLCSPLAGDASPAFSERCGRGGGARAWLNGAAGGSRAGAAQGLAQASVPASAGGALFGVLQCECCGYRVTSLGQLHCCAACAASSGAEHDLQCRKIPLLGLPPSAAVAARAAVSGRDGAGDVGAAPTAPVAAAESSSPCQRNDFNERLLELLAAVGPIRYADLQYYWDLHFGDGAWVKERPVKAPSKACQPPYTQDIQLIGDVIHAMQTLPDFGKESRDKAERDIDTLRDLDESVQELYEQEFKDATSVDWTVLSPTFKQVEGVYLAALDLHRALPEGEDPAALLPGVFCDEGQTPAASSSSSAAATPAASRPVVATASLCQVQDGAGVCVVSLRSEGYGQDLESARFSAKLEVLRALGRFCEFDDPLVKEILEGRECIKELQSRIEAAREEASSPASKAKEAVREILLQLLGRLAALFKRRRLRCPGACWELLRSAWFFVLLGAADEMPDYFRLVGSVKDCEPPPPLDLWQRVAFMCTWSSTDDALEAMDRVRVPGSSGAAAYARYHLYSCLRELKAQLQELVDAALHFDPHKQPELDRKGLAIAHGLKVVWGPRHGLWQASFDPSFPGVGKGTVLMITSGESQQGYVLCEVTDEGKAVLRGCHDFGFLLEVMRCTRPRAFALQPYLLVHERQRDALRRLLCRDEEYPYDHALSSIIVDTWAAPPVKRSHQDSPAVLQARSLASECPDELQPVADEAEDAFDPGGSGAPTNSTGTGRELFRDLSPNQLVAVRNASTRRLSLVRGPPGTGKTHVAAAIIATATAGLPEEAHVLGVTQSHAAAINLHRRLEQFGLPAARVGYSLKPHEVMQQRLAKELLAEMPEDEDMKLLAAAAEDRLWSLGQAGGDSSGSEALAYGASGPSPQQVQTAQSKVMWRLVSKARAVVMTCASAGNKHLLKGFNIPLLVIDEAAQAIEPSPWVALSCGAAGMAAVGDDRQLPATVQDHLAARRGLGTSLFERCIRDGIVTWEEGLVQLDEQHRMHPSIAAFPAQHFYRDGGRIINAFEVSEKPRALPIEGFPWPRPNECHVCLVECNEGVSVAGPSGRSRENMLEAVALTRVLARLLDTGMPPADIGVITGYSAQQALLQRKVAALPQVTTELKVDTIDSFQGSERELILASTVRASAGEVGFMRDPRRINVLLTRARRGLIVFGDPETLGQERQSWGPWLKWVRAQGSVLPVHSLMMQET